MLVRIIIKIISANYNENKYTKLNHVRLAYMKYEVGSVGNQILHCVSLQIYFFKLHLKGIHSRIYQHGLFLVSNYAQRRAYLVECEQTQTWWGCSSHRIALASHARRTGSDTPLPHFVSLRMIQWIEHWGSLNILFSWISIDMEWRRTRNSHI